MLVQVAQMVLAILATAGYVLYCFVHLYWLGGSEIHYDCMIQVLCDVCTIGYHNTGQQCELCRGGSVQYMLPIVIVIVLAATALIVFIGRRLDTTKFVAGAKVLVYVNIFYLNKFDPS